MRARPPLARASARAKPRTGATWVPLARSSPQGATKTPSSSVTTHGASAGPFVVSQALGSFGAGPSTVPMP
jgi:hypothetical protein